MILGIGVDIVDIARFEAALERTPTLRERLFTEVERPLPVQSLAARFAAKEAVAKALGGPRGVGHLEAEVRCDETGKPEIRVTGKAADVADGLGIKRWHISLSHDAGVAVAYVIAEG
ncbi:holo-ACP synthase [Nonomuraea sp. NPDC048916]|uniref:holo-ACP synthase n=1 Tax=Nonomuraea sp. NPDC048916 TaxID=3154232 RepID=UPI0034046529